MKQTIGLYEFRNAFDAHERNNFSYEGQEVLFDALEEIESASGEEIELDVIALCCDYSEMDLQELLNYYDITDDELTDDNEAELLELATDYIAEHTFLCGVTPQNTFVFQSF